MQNKGIYFSEYSLRTIRRALIHYKFDITNSCHDLEIGLSEHEKHQIVIINTIINMINNCLYTKQEKDEQKL